ncbi:hypothetical protein MMC25_005364 [Agyrium rufum]|nr:hypothetical protein [Agyrium rufum]
MSILVQPPERCIVGVPLPTPIVVQVSQQALSSSIGRLMDQASGMYALLSVYSSDGSTMLAPGSRSNLVSLHSTLATVQVLLPIRTEQELGFLVYPNVVFREPGIFLLRFSLMDQNGPANRNAESSRTLADFPCVATRSIHVQQDGSQGTVDDEEQNILQTLRQRGLDV